MSGADVGIAVKALVREIKTAAKSRAYRGVNELRNAALEVLSQNGTGRKYGRYIASAPGQTPAPRKGNLRKNWRQNVSASGDLRLTLKITSTMFYAPFLEYGTRKMAPRPYKKKIKQKARPKIIELFGDL